MIEQFWLIYQIGGFTNQEIIFNLMLTLSILSVLFTQDTCATGSSILTCEIRKEVFLHGYKSARALRKTNTARISKVIYVGIARKVSLFHVGTCRVSSLQNLFFYSHINAPHYTLLTYPVWLSDRCFAEPMWSFWYVVKIEFPLWDNSSILMANNVPRVAVTCH